MSSARSILPVDSNSRTSTNTTVASKDIVFFEIKGWEEAFIKDKFDNFEYILCPDELSSENAREYSGAEIISVFINSRLTADLLSKLPNLKLIATRSTGFDHIDLKYCEANNIKVANVPDYGANTVAEHAMMLIFALYKKLPESIERVSSGRFDPQGLTGKDLKGKILGVVGTGSIGQYMMRLGVGIGMSVLAYDIKPRVELAKEIGFEYVDYSGLLAKADIITYHVPLCDDTRHMLNADNIETLKHGAVVINTSRGGVIGTHALLSALHSGKVSAAGLDVLEGEDFLKEELELLHQNPNNIDYRTALENHILADLPNVIITPHNAFNTDEALKRIIATTIENIKCHESGNCTNLVQSHSA